MDWKISMDVVLQYMNEDGTPPNVRTRSLHETPQLATVAYVAMKHVSAKFFKARTAFRKHQSQKLLFFVGVLYQSTLLKSTVWKRIVSFFDGIFRRGQV